MSHAPEILAALVSLGIIPDADGITPYIGNIFEKRPNYRAEILALSGSALVALAPSLEKMLCEAREELDDDHDPDERGGQLLAEAFDATADLAAMLALQTYLQVERRIGALEMVVGAAEAESESASE